MIAFIGISISSFAQRDEIFQPNHDDYPYYLGINLGTSNYFFSIHRASNFNANSTHKFFPLNTQFINLGLSGTLKLNNRFLLRSAPTLMINGNKSFMVSNDIDPNKNDIYSTDAVFFDIPIDLKFQSDRYNAFKFPEIMRHYVFGGFKYSFDMSSKNPSINGIEKVHPLLIKGSDLAYEFGFGLSFFLRYAIISPEVKFSYGLTNLVKPTSNTPPLPIISLNSVDKLTSNFIYFTLHVEGTL